MQVTEFPILNLIPSNNDTNGYSKRLNYKHVSLYTAGRHKVPTWGKNVQLAC